MAERPTRFGVRGPERRGAQGWVQRAYDHELGREIALKRPAEAHPAAVTDFLREAGLLASVRHPAIVGYLAHGLDPEIGPFLATAWIDGGSLAERLLSGPLPIDEVLLLGARLADGLSVLHAAGVCHGDVQPANVLVGDIVEGPVLIDLGLAGRPAMGSQPARGTPGFAAPELTLGGRLGTASDLFSLGALLWMALAGRAPFATADPAHTVARAALDEPPALRPLRDDLPRALEILVEQMLARSAESRPSAAEARDRLLAIGAVSAPAASWSRLPSPRYVARPPMPLRGRRRELSLLEAAVTPGKLVLVSGAAGAGKTALRRVFSAHARERGALVWEATAQRGDGDFAGIRRLLASALELPTPAAETSETPEPRPDERLLRAFVTRWAPVPEQSLTTALLGDLWGLTMPGAEALMGPARNHPALWAMLLDQAFGALVDAAASHGLVLVVDDVAFMDEPSRRSIGAAVARGKTRALMLSRPAAVGDEPTRFAGAALETFPLEDLDEAAERALLVDAWPEIEPAQVTALLASGSGSPRLLVALADARWQPPDAVPEALRTLLAARLHERSPLEKRLIWSTALLGHRAARAGIAAVLGDLASPTLLARVLDRLVSAGLLVTDEAAQTVAFRHDLFRHVACDEAPPELWSALHERALAWLTARGQENALRAWDAERAGRLEEAAAAYGAAGWHALRTDVRLGLHSCERALACRGGEEGRAALGRIMALAWLARWDLAEPRAESALHEAAKGSARGIMGAATLCFRALETGRPERVRALMTQLCEVEPESEARELLAWALGVDAFPLYALVGDPSLARRTEQRLQALVADPPTPAQSGLLARTRALSAFFVHGDLGLARAAAYEAVTHHQRERDIVPETQARSHLGLIDLAVGRVDEAAEGLAIALSLAQRAGAEAVVAYARLGLAEALLAQRLPEPALGLALLAADDAKLRGSHFLRAWGLRALAAVHLQQRDPEEARRLVDEALEALPAPCPERVAALVLRADILEAMGASRLAIESAAQAVAIIEAPSPLVLDAVGARGRLASLLLSQRTSASPAELALVERALADLSARAATLPEGARSQYLTRPAAQRVIALGRRFVGRTS